MWKHGRQLDDRPPKYPIEEVGNVKYPRLGSEVVRLREQPMFTMGVELQWKSWGDSDVDTLEEHKKQQLFGHIRDNSVSVPKPLSRTNPVWEVFFCERSAYSIWRRTCDRKLGPPHRIEIIPPTRMSQTPWQPTLRMFGCAELDRGRDDDIEDSDHLSVAEAHKRSMRQALSGYSDCRGFTSWTRSRKQDRKKPSAKPSLPNGHTAISTPRPHFHPLTVLSQAPFSLLVSLVSLWLSLFSSALSLSARPAVEKSPRVGPRSRVSRPTVRCTPPDFWKARF